MYHIIIVEDDPMVAAINEQYIKQNPSFSLDACFTNGKEALDYLEDHEVDLAVVDCYMPVMDGITFLREVRHKNYPLNVIMITAANSGAEVQDALRLGIVDYIIKPFSYERFQTAMERFRYAKNALPDTDRIDQNTFDSLFRGQGDVPSNAYDTQVKGVQPQTLERIENHLAENASEFLSCDEIANAISLSRITVRRYLNYLLESGKITSRIDYSTGGRPSIRYRLL